MPAEGQLLPYRRVKAEVLAGGDDAANLCVLMDLTWCRFNREGWYDGGGRFLEMISVNQTHPGGKEN